MRGVKGEGTGVRGERWKGISKLLRMDVSLTTACEETNLHRTEGLVHILDEGVCMSG